MINNHIVKNLNNYIESKLPFEYAILLTGSWGSGKTFFIKDYINRSDENILYISLNGLETLDDLYYLIVESKYLKDKKDKISLGALKSINHISKIVALDKEEMELDIDNLLKFNEKTILIFDDIERVSKKIEINDLLGFIFREFIEKMDAKVILVANEEEIFAKWIENNEYQKIKEKLIGKTFEIQSDIDSAYDNFTKDLLESREIFNKYKDIILDIHRTSRYNNLRILKQSVYEFNRLYSILDEEIKNEEKIVKKFLIEFIINSIEYKKSNPNIELFESNNFSKDDFEDSNKKSVKEKYKILKKVSEIDNYQIIYNVNWENLLTKGIFDNRSIFIDKDIEEEPLWKRLYNNQYKSDNEFNDNILKAIKNLKKRDILEEIKEVGELKHIIAILLWGYNNRFNIIIKNYNSLEDIIKNGKNYLEFMIKNKVTNDINQEKDTNFYDFYSRDLKEFKNFLKYIDLRYKKENNFTLLERAKEIFKTLDKENIYEFDEILNNSLNTTPILKDFSPKIFLKKTLDPTLREELLDILKIRYKSSDSILNLFEEFDFFKEYYNLLDKKLGTLMGELSYYKIDKYSSAFDNILESFKYIERIRDDLEFETVEEISQGYNYDYIKKIKEFFDM